MGGGEGENQRGLFRLLPTDPELVPLAKSPAWSLVGLGIWPVERNISEGQSPCDQAMKSVTMRSILLRFLTLVNNQLMTEGTQDMRATVDQRQYYPSICYSEEETPYLLTGTKVVSPHLKTDPNTS